MSAKKKVKEYQAWRDPVGKDKVITPDMLVKDIMDRLSKEESKGRLKNQTAS